jgi:pimeloyl-ACP methyl ester carboxylesterase
VDTAVSSLQIDVLEPVVLGGVMQWIRIRGADRDNPVLLLMQQGPGLPIINEVPRLDHRLGLEQAFTVVYWDQRGTGLSARSVRNRQDRLDITVTNMVHDTIDLLEMLRDRYERKPFVAGFSFGATFAAYAAVKRPDLVATLIAVGMDIDMPAAERHTYQFVLTAARQRNNIRAVQQLEAIGPPPHLTSKHFRTRAKWAANFDGVTRDATFNSLLRSLLSSVVRSPDYSAADVVRTLRGFTTSQAALLPELANTDLVRTVPSLDVPLVMVQGRLDHVAPPAAAQRFYDSVTAPSKQLIWFEDSAHTPHFDEPDKFRDVLLDVARSQRTTAT